MRHRTATGRHQRSLAPTLRPGDIVIMDNLQPHKSALAETCIRRRDAQLWFLPPYSPDFNPIEEMWSKVKAYLRKAKARTQTALDHAVADALAAITATDAKGWFAHSGYGRMQS
jgi:transposase